ncbi:hypothetical protein PN836_010775 [Ningiella sp. W23]|uniref:hypothetical protein n=1 Tax=Ningiella sp. W23 TaxID=3023715 RepID=UPI003757B471
MNKGGLNKEAVDNSSDKSLSSQNLLDESITQMRINSEKLPSRDLWQGIEYGIQGFDKHEVYQEKSVHRGWGFGFQRTAVFASVFAVMLVAGLSFYAGHQSQSELLVKSMSENHQQQKQALLASFENMSPASNDWQKQMQELDEAEDAIKKALETSPNNPALLRMLKQVYQQQLALIEKAHVPSWQHI